MKSNIDILRPQPFSLLNEEPFGIMRRFERQMSRLFDDFYTNLEPTTRSSFESGLTPACDFEETENHYLLSFDLPGVPKENMNVEVRGNQLTVTADRKREHKEKEVGRLYEEREFGQYQRTMTLPSEIHADKLEANYHDGVLRIAIPKAEGAKTQKIKIGEAKAGWWDRLLPKPEQKKVEASKSAA